MFRLVLCLAAVCLSVATITLNSTHSARLDSANAKQPALVVPTQIDMHSVRQFPITVKDFVFDRNTGKFYASIPSRAGAMGNSIAKIDPVSGQVEGFVFVGSEPGKLAISDDGHSLYVSLEGASAVRKFDITTQTAGQQFGLGDSTSNGPFFVNDLAVAPGEPNVVAVSRKNMRSVEINLITGAAAESRCQNRQTPIEQSCATQSSGGNQNYLAFSKCSNQDREVTPMREELHGHVSIERTRQLIGNERRNRRDIAE